MDKWNQEEQPVKAGYNPEAVQRYCVRETEWQFFRLSLKGVPTHHKLQMLSEWYAGAHSSSYMYSQAVRELQVGNYLGALRRGGQLDGDNRVQRFL